MIYYPDLGADVGRYFAETIILTPHHPPNFEKLLATAVSLVELSSCSTTLRMVLGQLFLIGEELYRQGLGCSSSWPHPPPTHLSHQLVFSAASRVVQLRCLVTVNDPTLRVVELMRRAKPFPSKKNLHSPNPAMRDLVCIFTTMT